MLVAPVNSISSRSMPTPTPPGGRHRVLQRAQEIDVQLHRFGISAGDANNDCSVKRARCSTGIYQFGVTGAELPAENDQIPALGQPRNRTGAGGREGDTSTGKSR